MSDKKVPCFYTKMINKLNSLDDKVGDIQKSIKIFRAMIDERMGPLAQTHNDDDVQAIRTEEKQKLNKEKVNYE